MTSKLCIISQVGLPSLFSGHKPSYSAQKPFKMNMRILVQSLSEAQPSGFSLCQPSSWAFPGDDSDSAMFAPTYSPAMQPGCISAITTCSPTKVSKPRTTHYLNGMPLPRSPNVTERAFHSWYLTPVIGLPRSSTQLRQTRDS
jgi:hypothetical protein